MRACRLIDFYVEGDLQTERFYEFCYKPKLSVCDQTAHFRADLRLNNNHLSVGGTTLVVQFSYLSHSNPTTNTLSVVVVKNGPFDRALIYDH